MAVTRVSGRTASVGQPPGIADHGAREPAPVVLSDHVLVVEDPDLEPVPGPEEHVVDISVGSAGSAEEEEGLLQHPEGVLLRVLQAELASLGRHGPRPRSVAEPGDRKEEPDEDPRGEELAEVLAAFIGQQDACQDE